tara:strand:- start:159 stop:605 length:447 start_codon:yes stop_codon:yes gene_type:complete
MGQIAFNFGKECYSSLNRRVAVMAKAKLGTKRTCTSCGLRYYDLNKTPIICPSCAAEFDPESLLKTRKSRHISRPVDDEEGKVADVTANDLNQKIDDTSSSDNESISNELDYGDDDVGEVDEEAGGLIQDDISADDELLNNIPNSDDS